jgi:2-phosphosulfolactate phosphatase
VRPPGFDQGNSPREATRARGFELVLATTNGAPTIVAAAAHAADVLLGSLLNLDALIAELRNRVDPPEADIQIVCSGTDGAPALEDVYVAGRISAALSGARSDSARIAEAVARAFTAPRAALGASADAAILCANGMAADIDYCARTSELDHVPVVAAASAGVASVVSCQRFDRHRRVGATRPPERAVTAPRSAAPHRAGMR